MKYFADMEAGKRYYNAGSKKIQLSLTREQPEMTAFV
jgi:hypothetical protein